MDRQLNRCLPAGVGVAVVWKHFRTNVVFNETLSNEHDGHDGSDQQVLRSVLAQGTRESTEGARSHQGLS